MMVNKQIHIEYKTCVRVYTCLSYIQSTSLNVITPPQLHQSRPRWLPNKSDLNEASFIRRTMHKGPVQQLLHTEELIHPLLLSLPRAAFSGRVEIASEEILTSNISSARSSLRNHHTSTRGYVRERLVSYL